MMSAKEPLEASNLFEINVLGNLSPKPIMVALWSRQDKIIYIDSEKQLLVRDPVGAWVRVNPLGAPLL